MNLKGQTKNELRKKIQNYSYGLNDHLDLTHQGNIFKGVNELTEQRVAIKVINLKRQEVKEWLSCEVEALKKLRNHNVIHCFDIYSTVNNCYIITEFCEQGSLDNILSSRLKLSESEAVTIFKDIVTAFFYLIQEKYIHANLKPSCILFKDGVVKVSGFSNVRKMTAKQIKKQVGFHHFQSPQSARDGLFTHKGDIWALGMILYITTHGSLPWEYNSKPQFLQKCGKPFALSSELSEDIKDFIKKCLQPKESRLGVEELGRHPFIERLLNGCLSNEKYLGVLGDFPPENIPKPKKDPYQQNLNKTQKQISCQINWMRFLYRLFDKFNGYAEQPSTINLKFIVLRQFLTQFQELKLAIFQGVNTFNFIYWKQFTSQKDKVAKYTQILKKNEGKEEKIRPNYRRLMDKMGNNSHLESIMNQKFTLSQFNSIISLKIALEQIRKLWGKIIKESLLKVQSESPFRFKSQLLLLDFIITYYQLNCILVDDFHRMDYFEKMSKLEVILEAQPIELDASHLEEFSQKLKLLGIVE